MISGGKRRDSVGPDAKILTEGVAVGTVGIAVLHRFRPYSHKLASVHQLLVAVCHGNGNRGHTGNVFGVALKRAVRDEVDVRGKRLGKSAQWDLKRTEREGAGNRRGTLG